MRRLGAKIDCLNHVGELLAIAFAEWAAFKMHTKKQGPFSPHPNQP